MKVTPPFLQSYVVPVVTYNVLDGNAVVQRSFGTAFFVNNEGLFLTASHVVRAALSECVDGKTYLGLVVKDDEFEAPISFVTPIWKLEGAPQGSDIAIGIVPKQTRTLLNLTEADAEIWQRVATLGYPTEAITGPIDGLRLNIRGQQGIVQRKFEVGDFFISPNCEGYELDFMLSSGMSGGPLFVPSSPRDIVVGVCVGTWQTEQEISNVTEIHRNGTVYKEVSKNITRYGVAERITPILSWQPTILYGFSLRDFLSGMRPRGSELYLGKGALEVINIDSSR